MLCSIARIDELSELRTHKVMRDFRTQAEALREELVARRRDFHQHPEIAFEEVRTAGIVARVLGELGLEVQTGVGRTGVVGLLEGDQEGPTVLVRFDMDALPIQEANDVAYRSQTPQRMHACGHDAHTAIGLAVARMLSAHRGELRGRVKFIFQPAEEIGQGAFAMIEDGILGDPTPEVSLGLHVWNELPVGEVALTAGGTMAGANVFSVEITGRGGHAAIPNQTADPVVAMAQMITALQSIVSRNVSPLDTAVVSVTRVQAGDAFNVIPDNAAFHGTIRTFNQDSYNFVVGRLQKIVAGIAETMDCEASISFRRPSPPVTNDPGTTARLKNGFAQLAPEWVYRDSIRTMAAEDMGFILERVPGVFFFVGSANPERGLNYPHHNPRFDFDEEALVIGASLLASAVSDYVLP
jgi:amidohydrolase